MNHNAMQQQSGQHKSIGDEERVQMDSKPIINSSHQISIFDIEKSNYKQCYLRKDGREQAKHIQTSCLYGFRQQHLSWNHWELIEYIEIIDEENNNENKIKLIIRPKHLPLYVDELHQVGRSKLINNREVIFRKSTRIQQNERVLEDSIRAALETFNQTNVFSLCLPVCALHTRKLNRKLPIFEILKFSSVPPTWN